MKKLSFIVALMVIIILFGCKKDNGIDTGETHFNIELFEQALVDSLSNQVPGFGYAINQDQILYSKGNGGFADVGRLVPFTPDLRMHIGSVSKTITAAAVLKILSKTAGVNVDSPVYSYLPDNWVLGPNVDKLTFRNLLTHKSGFVADSTLTGGYYSTLQQMIKKGLDESKRGVVHEYVNDNYSLFRIILPILSGLRQNDITVLDSLNIAWSYMQVIHEELFDPMGIPQAYCHQLSNQLIRYYSCANSNIADGGDLTDRCGAYGWHLSAFDLAAFMAHLRYNDAIFDPAIRKLMDDGILGWENEHSSANGEHGTYLFHSGQWHYGGSSGAGLRTCAMKFAETKVEVTLLINCVDHPNPNIRSPRNLLRKIFDNSWE